MKKFRVVMIVFVFISLAFMQVAGPAEARGNTPPPWMLIQGEVEGPAGF